MLPLHHIGMDLIVLLSTAKNALDKINRIDGMYFDLTFFELIFLVL